MSERTPGGIMIEIPMKSRANFGRIPREIPAASYGGIAGEIPDGILVRISGTIPEGFPF